MSPTIRFSVGNLLTWPTGWPVPRVGDDITLDDGTGMKVTVVDWMPSGEGDPTDPFVYVVLR